MEKYVVSGTLEQMENCFGYMTDKYAEKGYEVAKLRVESAASQTALLQIRKTTSLMPKGMCVTLKMSLVESGVCVEVYRGTWYDNQKTAFGCLFDSLYEMLCKSIFLEAIAFFTRRENS